MDKVLADTLKANLKSAATSEARQQAQTLAMIAVVDCQFKTSERVKKLVEDKEAEKNRKIGAKIAVASIVGLASVVGPVIAIKICKVVGVLW